MGIYRRGHIYYLDYYFEGKRIQKAVGPDRKLAEMVLKKKLVEIAEHKHLDIKKMPKARFEDLVNKYLKNYAIPEIKRSWHSDVDTIKALNRWFGGKYLHEITPELVTKFKVERKREVSVATTNRGLACLRTMLNKAKEWDMFDADNPVTKVKLFKENNKRLRFLEQEEIEKLLANCSEHLKPIVICALHTGMRKSEILHLKWRDCDFRRDIIYITESKNGERREIPMDGFLKKTLIAIPKHPESPFIFCNKDGKSYGDIKKSFFTACKKASIINFRFHDLRHTFASQMRMSGVGIDRIAEYLGHKSLQMTQRYAHLSPDYRKGDFDALCQRITKKSLQNSDKLVTQTKISELSTEPIFDNSLEHREIINTWGP